MSEFLTYIQNIVTSTKRGRNLKRLKLSDTISFPQKSNNLPDYKISISLAKHSLLQTLDTLVDIRHLHAALCISPFVI